MSHQLAPTPENFSAEELELALNKTRAIAPRVNADQRWRLNEILKQFNVGHPMRVGKEKRLTCSQEAVQPFRFLDLPPELRNRIYEYCVTSPDDLLLPAACRHSSEPQAVQPPITRTCRQVRGEALPLFNQLNVFRAHIHRCDFSHMISYLDTLKDCKSIKQISLIVQYEQEAMSCGAGLGDLVTWYALSEETRMVFRTHGWGGDVKLIALGKAFELAVDQYHAGSTKEEVHAAFGDWLSKEGLECHCEGETVSKRCSRSINDVRSWVCDLC